MPRRPAERIPRGGLFATLASLLLALTLAAGSARAQPADGPPAQLELVVEQFGVGGLSRPGSMVGVELSVTDNTPTPRRVAIRWHVKDPDGDTLLAERRVTLNPGLATPAWLYARLPWSTTSQSVFVFTVEELVDRGAGPAGIGRRLTAVRQRPGRVIDPTFDLIGVVGARSLGLRQYQFAGGESHPAAHERLEVVTGLQPLRMPDTALGLEPYSVLVWESGAPTDLGQIQRPQAVREWVARGGHLIVVLEQVGSGWLAQDNPLADLMPSARVDRFSGRTLRNYASVLVNRGDEERLPNNASIHSFDIAADTPPADAMCIVEGADGCVVVRRLYGLGMVTVVGLDLRVNDWTRGDTFQADIFWHRLIGKRFDIMSDEDLADLNAAGQRSPFNPFDLDRFFAAEIDRSTAAGVGVLLALVVFVGYWLIGGPIGFWLLGLRDLRRHAWVAFVATVGVFSVVAWLGANRLRETELSASHLTFIDHVYGQPVQRAKSWASVLLPGYGDQRLAVGTGRGDQAWIQSITPWGPAEGSALTLKFPDARSYAIASDDPSSARIPARSTVKQLRLSTLGPRRWKTPVPSGADSDPATVSGQPSPLRGVLTHDLPGPLDNVTIVLQDRAGAPVDEARFARLAEPWAPGEPLDLAGISPWFAAENLFGPTGLGVKESGSVLPGRNQQSRYVEGQARRDYERLGWFATIQPPTPGDGAELFSRPRLVRSEGHGLDLSRWLTQPSIVITGHVRGRFEGEDAPVALRAGPPADERQAPMDGWTVVRWVYPLPPSPERATAIGAAGGGR